MLLTNAQVSKLGKAFTNNSSANIKLWKTQLHKIGPSGRFLGGLLLKTRLPLMKNVLKPLAKSVLIPLDLTAALAINPAFYNKMFGPGTRLSDLVSRMATLIISNEETNDIMKIIKCPKESGLLIKGVSETIQNKVKEWKADLLVCY